MKKLLANISEDKIGDYAAQCSYYTVLSFIPFAILLISLIQYTGIEAQTVFNIISEIVPTSMNELILGIVQEVYSKSITTISISVIFTIWSAGKGLFQLTKGLQSIYNTDDKAEPSYIYLRLKAIIETIIFIVLIVMGLVALIFSDSIISVIKENFGIFNSYNTLMEILAKILFIFATFIVFLLIYRLVPKHKVTFRSQIYGALFGAIALNVISFVFSIYLDIFKGFSITYGSLTTLMLVMMWVYACFYAVFLGAELNKTANKKDTVKYYNGLTEKKN